MNWPRTIATSVMIATSLASAADRQRVIVTSDGEIDDECSLVRFLLYVNEWDVEGIITSSSQYHWHGHNWAGDDWAQPFLDAYEAVHSNLIKHDPRYPTADWMRANILEGHGALCSLYQAHQPGSSGLSGDYDFEPGDFRSEGDSPAFLNMIPTGLRSLESPGYGRWGGRFKRVREFDKANHAPVARIEGPLDRSAAPGDTVQLDARSSSDPDGDEISIRWWQYLEAGTALTKVEIADANAPTASFTVPNEPGKQLHLILEVTDNGSPALVAYQ